MTQKCLAIVKLESVSHVDSLQSACLGVGNPHSKMPADISVLFCRGILRFTMAFKGSVHDLQPPPLPTLKS